MSETSDNTITTESGDVPESGNGGKGTSVYAFVIRSAGIAAAVFVALLALLASFVSAAAPRVFMEFYRSLGAYGMAAVYAGEAVDRASSDDGCTDGGCDYILLVSDALDIASAAYGDSPTAAHAEYMYKFCNAYLSASCHEAHSDTIDDYYERAYAHSPVMFCEIYGYGGHVLADRVTAMRALSDKAYDGLLGEGYENCGTFGDALRILTEKKVQEFAVSPLSAIDELTAYAAGSDDVAALESAAAEIDEPLEDLFDGMVQSVSGELTGLPEAYVLYKLYRFADAMESAGGSETFENTWTSARTDAAYGAFADAVSSVA